MNLFGQAHSRPLAYLSRPTNKKDYYGFSRLVGRYPFLQDAQLSSFVMYGPSGCGKTSLAHLLAIEYGRGLISLNASIDGIQKFKDLLSEDLTTTRKKIVFIDEIHRFNKGQQEVLCPYVESNQIILIGATTQNPRVALIYPLFSRLMVVEVQPPSDDEIKEILLATYSRWSEQTQSLSLNIADLILSYAGSDVRKAISFLEMIIKNESNLKDSDGGLDCGKVEGVFAENARAFDKKGDRHYDVMSAFIKSMRGSDPQSAMLWLAVMLDGGQDPLYIARRMIIFASEDIGNADPKALEIAINVFTAVEKIGLPECMINIAHGVTYLSSTVKSNASYLALKKALAYVKGQKTVQVPLHLRNNHQEKEKYLYPHDFPNHHVEQFYGIQGVEFYDPSSQGFEKNIRQRLNSLKNSNNQE